MILESGLFFGPPCRITTRKTPFVGLFTKEYKWPRLSIFFVFTIPSVRVAVYKTAKGVCRPMCVTFVSRTVFAERYLNAAHIQRGYRVMPSLGQGLQGGPKSQLLANYQNIALNRIVKPANEFIMFFVKLYKLSMQYTFYARPNQ